MDTTWTLPTDVAVAYVNHGRWVADCPDQECHGAEDTLPSPITGVIGLNRHRMICTNCGRTWPVEWPMTADMIVAVLMQRPRKDNRHWWPWESVEDLLVENMTHGFGVPDKAVAR